MGIKIVQRQFSDPQVRRAVSRLLKGNVLCSMATVGPGSKAWINTAYFAYSNKFELFFCSYPDSTHAKNIRGNPSMAMTIFSSTQSWGKPDRGLQLFGECKEVDRKKEVNAAAIYGKRFPGFRKWRNGLTVQGEFPLRFYRFTPHRFKVLDETEFGAGVFVLSSPD